MKVNKITIGKKSYSALYFTYGKKVNFAFNKEMTTSGHAGHFYLNKENALLKIEPCKYQLKNNFIKWLGRDLLKKIFLTNLALRQEAKGYRIVQALGISTPKLYGWGCVLGMSSPYLSFIIISYENNAMLLSDYYNSAPCLEQDKIIKKLAKELKCLAYNGYLHRDVHLNNFLIDKTKSKLIWIDVNLKKLPKSSKQEHFLKSCARVIALNIKYKKHFML